MLCYLLPTLLPAETLQDAQEWQVMSVPGLPEELKTYSCYQQCRDTLLETVATSREASVSKPSLTVVPFQHCPCLCTSSHMLTGIHSPMSVPPACGRLSHQPLSGLCLLGDHGAVCILSIWLGTHGRKPSWIASHRGCSTSAWWSYLRCGLGVVTASPNTCPFLAVICCLSWISQLFSASWLAALAPVF